MIQNISLRKGYYFFLFFLCLLVNACLSNPEAEQFHSVACMFCIPYSHTRSPTHNRFLLSLPFPVSSADKSNMENPHHMEAASVRKMFLPNSDESFIQLCASPITFWILMCRPLTNNPVQETAPYPDEAAKMGLSKSNYIDAD